MVDEAAALAEELVARTFEARAQESHLTRVRRDGTIAQLVGAHSFLVLALCVLFTSGNVVGIILDSHQKRVVHQVVGGEDFDVGAHDFQNLATVPLTEPQPDLLLVHGEHVLVLECRRGLEVLALDDTIDHGTFEVEDAKDV